MKIKYIVFSVIGFCLVVVLSSCATMPKGAVTISNFDLDQYLGSWYEIARLDHSFERNMNNTTANYTLRDDGAVRVLNKGYRIDKKKWDTAEGVAKFRGDSTKGELKVSFFGPFYGGYNILALDEKYQYSLVAGPSLKYLWILSREKAIPDEVKEKYLSIATSLGYDVDKLIFVEHSN